MSQVPAGRRYGVRMSAPQPPPVVAGLQWIRAVFVAALTWGAASAGHVAAGGALPSWPFIVAVVGLTAWPLSLALGRRAGLLRMIALMSAGQAVMHTALVAASWNATGRSYAPSGHSHQAPTGLAEVSGSHAMPLLPSPAMLLAHLMAALVLGAVLSDGERVLFTLLGLLAHVCPPQLLLGRRILSVLALLASGTGPCADPVQGLRVDHPQRHLRERVLVTSLGRRGPPLHCPA